MIGRRRIEVSKYFPDLTWKNKDFPQLNSIDYNIRASTADMLADLGYHVVEASSAEEAMRLFEGKDGFELVVTDHLMPGMNGTDLARAVQTVKPNMPVLLVSGYAENEGVDASIPRLAKPFRKDELASSLASLPALQ